MGKLSENKGYSNAKEKMFILSTTSYLLYDLCCALSFSQLLLVGPNLRCAPTIQDSLECTPIHTHPRDGLRKQTMVERGRSVRYQKPSGGVEPGIILDKN